MNKNRHDIEDNQIRVIQHSASTPSTTDELLVIAECTPQSRRSHLHRYKWLFIIGLVIIAALAATYVCVIDKAPANAPDATATRQAGEGGLELRTSPGEAAEGATTHPQPGYTTVSDTTIQGQQLTLLTPHNATPCLLVGAEYLDDAGNAVLMLQAADVRGDNQAINCAFVQKGQQLARGRGKAGYCAILDGKIRLGTASYTPLLEECIERGGDFFRQYPLVAGSSRVNNTRQDKALRRALAQIDGEIVAVISHERMSLDSFADLLVGLGADEAIYLVGSSAFGTFRTQDGERVSFGNRHKWENVNFIACGTDNTVKPL